MDTKQIPLSINKTRHFYSDFGSRLGAGLLDGLIMCPVWITAMIINSHNMNTHYYTLLVNLVFGLWYMVYLPKRYGGTPGKLISGLKIVKMDGGDIGWEEAFLRYSVSLGFALLTGAATIQALMQADPETFNEMGWLEQTQYLESFMPFYQSIFVWGTCAWLLVDIIVYFADDRSRALHDKLAGTVVIKKMYDDMIKEHMANPSEPESGSDIDSPAVV
jgi:uncharacterized RDD family membrane protein YckC